ncbi:Sua5/YciO/YrdC/YwlC family protein, partial [Paludibacteraceae bacterium OttesenSCG-928-F17]|nr:Sua5/YciO/YrdC/YwlC family protein [Paludibacteraceae bacterium OttesenSCG-928-F17]
MRDDINKALEILRAGGVILYPTDTIWGLGCDATNEDAVKRIYDIKKRTDNKAMLVLMDSTAKLPAYVDDVPDIAWDLIEVSEKPMTIIYPHARNLAKNLIAEDGSVGIRITNEIFSKTLCERFKKPV